MLRKVAYINGTGVERLYLAWSAADDQGLYVAACRSGPLTQLNSNFRIVAADGQTVDMTDLSPWLCPLGFFSGAGYPDGYITGAALLTWKGMDKKLNYARKFRYLDGNEDDQNQDLDFRGKYVSPEDTSIGAPACVNWQDNSRGVRYAPAELPVLVCWTGTDGDQKLNLATYPTL